MSGLRGIVRAVSLLGLVVPLTGSGQSSGLPAGSLQDSRAEFQMMIYMLPEAPPDLDRVVGSALRALPHLRRVAAFPRGETAGALVATNLLDLATLEFPMPSAEVLSRLGHGLNRGQILALAACREVLVMDFRIADPMSPAAHRDAHSLLAAVARECGALIADDETGETFTPDAWDARRAIPEEDDRVNLLQHTLVEFDESETRLLRAATRGMRKFGLPDVVCAGLPRIQARLGARAVNLAALALGSGVAPDASGRFRLRVEDIRPASARRAAEQVLPPAGPDAPWVELRPTARTPSDPGNRMVALSFGPYEGPDESARQQAFLRALFGGREERPEVRNTDAVLAASTRARERLPEWRRRFQAGFAPGEALVVKVEKTVPGEGLERLWVEVLAWPEGGPVAGILQSAPVRVKDLVRGQRVTVDETEIFDIMLLRPDGSFEGNETGVLLLEQLEKKP